MSRTPITGTTPSEATVSVRTRATRLGVGALVATALGAGLFAAPLAESTAAAASKSDTYESTVLKYTNAERTKKHKAKLKADSCVDKYAESQARAMAKKQKLYHQDLGKILKACKLGGVGENVAYGYPSGKTVVNAWMHSTGHRENILRTPYRQLGVGAVQDSKGRWWVAQVFGNKR